MQDCASVKMLKLPQFSSAKTNHTYGYCTYKKNCYDSYF
uniref:Uncharacterized protein n=1 Tax=Anguilla anguilla TaxID=7936 RepID=A0A0E9S6W5_ANGAN